MSTTETNPPAAQRKSGLHRDWTVDGCTVRVTWKKGTSRCAVCGPVRGFWVVCARYRASRIGRTHPGGSFSEEFDGYGAFCDDHRAAKGTVPDIDYTRHAWHEAAGVGETEHLHPVAGTCDACGAPACSLLWRACQGCDDPSRWRTSTTRIIPFGGPVESRPPPCMTRTA
jgi:hypothetical protein